MHMFPLLLLFAFFMARLSTNYDSRISKGRYVVIRNRVLAKLLIEKENFMYKKYTLKKDQNKMSVTGLVFYVCNALILVLTAVLAIVPPIPCELFEIDATKFYLHADTLNEKIPAILTMILLCAEMLYYAVLMFRFRKEIEQKWIKILVWILVCIMGLTCIGIVAEMIIELFQR